ncbi:unnamed protein product [Brassica oleracea var. botrytis]
MSVLVCEAVIRREIVNKVLKTCDCFGGARSRISQALCCCRLFRWIQRSHQKHSS